ncbi:MAG: rhodanese-like domain-containing protein [Dehalococcoidia bacterium]|nr:rhodanese-like domain-containing protein [Dehalococcoidia bacterium]
MNRILAIITATIILFAGCNGTQDNPAVTSTGGLGTEIVTGNGSYWSVTPVQLASVSRANYFLVCVDDPISTIIGNTTTDLFVKVEEIDQNLDKFPADKNRRIVVYCIVGNKSRPASEALVAAGYTLVTHLEGGTARWQQQGYPVANYTGTP